MESTLALLEEMQKQCDLKESRVFEAQLPFLQRFDVEGLSVMDMPCVNTLCMDGNNRKTIITIKSVIAIVIAAILWACGLIRAGEVWVVCRKPRISKFQNPISGSLRVLKPYLEFGTR